MFIVDCERIGRRKSYILTFEYNQQLIDRIKELPVEQRKWDAINMGWILTAEGLFELIKKYRKSELIYFKFKDDKREEFIKMIHDINKKRDELKETIKILNENKDRWVKFKEELEKTYEDYREVTHKNLKDGISLYPHQIIGSMFLNQTRSALISHEMGLGKSLVSITYVEMNDFQRVIVITPNSLKFNYYNEVNKFTNSKAHILNWKDNKYTIDESKYIIFNYEYLNPSDRRKLLSKWNKLNIGKIDCVILDESHRIKSTKSNTYKNFKSLFSPKIFRDNKVSKVFLSGTPAPNRAHELYTVLNQISEIDFPTKTYFYEYYCGMKYDLDGWGYTQVADGKFEELFHKISPYTHRKRKEEVLKDLPEKTYQKIILEFSKKELSLYNEIEGDVVNTFFTEPKNNPLTTMIRLRQYLSSIKIKYLKEIINDVISTGEKVVIVDVFKDSLYELKEYFGDIAGIHTGDQSVEERALLVEQFQDPKSDVKIFLGSIQTCNYGLTLTAASKMFIITSPYVPGELDQVADRLHRIGQKNAVNIYLMVFLMSIDEYVFEIVEHKRKEIKKTIDNVDYETDMDESVLSELINKLKNKHGKTI